MIQDSGGRGGGEVIAAAIIIVVAVVLQIYLTLQKVQESDWTGSSVHGIL